MKCALLAIGSLMLSSTLNPEARERVTLRVLGPAEGETDVVWVQAVMQPTFAMKVGKGKVPQKGILQCRLEEQGVEREIGGVKGKFIVMECEGGVELGVSRVDFGGGK